MHESRRGALQAIERATPNDVRLLPDIEARASALFNGITALAEIPPHSISMDAFDAAQRAGLLWVARAPNGSPIGFVLVERLGDGLHLEEVDVLLEHGRRGVGRALVMAAWECAGTRSHTDPVHLSRCALERAVL